MADATLIPKRFANVTPNDNTPLSRVLGLHVGGAGNLVVQGVDGNTATFVVGANTYIKGQFTRVMAATTATGVVACMQD